jgi:hypothetical protein
MRASDAAGTISYGEFGAVHTYCGDWGVMAVNLHHQSPLPQHLRDTIAHLLAEALIKDLREHPPEGMVVRPR